MNPRYIRIVYAALIAGIVASVIGIYGLVTGIQRDAAIQLADSRDDLLWHTSQFRVELHALNYGVQQLLIGYGEVDQAELSDRFDVFWGRLASASEGAMGRRFFALPGARQTVSDALSLLAEYENTVLDPAAAERERLVEFVARFRELSNRFDRLAVAAVHEKNAEAQAAYEARGERITQVLIFFAGTLVLGGSLLVLLLIERNKVERLRRNLEVRVEERTAELAQSEQRYRTLVENAPEAIVVLDLALQRFVDVNDNACELFGLDRATLLEKGPVDISPPIQPDGSPSAQSASELIAGAMRGERPIFEWTHRRADGSDVACEIRLVRLPAERKLVRGSITDITQRRRNELELARYRENLEELVEERTQELKAAQNGLLRAERLAAIGQLTGTVSHELRNPLATIGASVEVLRRRLPDVDSRTENTLERIIRNIDRCNNIIEQLLDYARIQEPYLSHVDIDEWLQDLVGELNPPPSITVRTELGAGTSVAIDEQRFRQVLINLIENAWEAIRQPEETAAGEVVVASEVVDGRLLVHVSDDGPGVPEGNREAIFEPLFSTRVFGVGLGLPLVRQIMESHGGGVDLEMQRGRGATFTAWLPLDEEISTSAAQS